MAKLLILLALIAILAVTIEGKAVKQGPLDLGYVLSGVYGPPGKRDQDAWEYFKRTPFRYFKKLDENTILIRQSDGAYDELLGGYFKKSVDKKQPSLDETFSS